MKKLLTFLSLAALLACSSPRPEEPFPHYQADEEDWITYEGYLPSKDGLDVFVELSLFPGAPGMESHYRMIERPDPKSAFYGNYSSRGTYSVLRTAGASILEITGKTQTGAVFRANGMSQKYELADDLYLKSNGDYELLPVDESFQPIGGYKLTRRISPLFTVEGYFTVYTDTTDFYEKNTGKKWSVAQLGDYNEAVNKYHYLAKEKFEGVYVKALSYSVLLKDRQGEDVKALVFKKIIEIDSMPALAVK